MPSSCNQWNRINKHHRSTFSARDTRKWKSNITVSKKCRMTIVIRFGEENSLSLMKEIRRRRRFREKSKIIVVISTAIFCRRIFLVDSPAGVWKDAADRTTSDFSRIFSLQSDHRITRIKVLSKHVCNRKRKSETRLKYGLYPDSNPADDF